MRTIPIFRLLIVFAVAFSLASLTGPMSSSFHLPGIPAVRAINQTPCPVPLAGGGCSDFWVPAGPAEDTFVATIFTDEQSEFSDLQSNTPHIDFTDWPCTPDLCTPWTLSQNLQITSSISQAGNFEVQFLLANNFWGINFDYGNNPNGTQIRQGIWHMLDTALFASKEPSLSGQAVALDTPNPTDNIGSLPIANPCNWDSLFPESGPQCTVGAPGGTAYHLAKATGANGITWLQAPGSLDLNAAAAHFVAAGVATGFNPATSVLTGISAAAAAHVPNFFIRNDNQPRLHLGDSIAEQICYIFTASYNTPCPELTVTHGPITAFPGFTTSIGSVNLSWGIYTAAYGSPTGPLPFDSTYYFTYNSNFVSGFPGIQSPAGHCAPTSVGTVSSADYIYQCTQTYDSLTNQMEFAPCLTAPGDPATPQQIATFGVCTGAGSLASTFKISTGSTRTITQGTSTTLPVTVSSVNAFVGSVSLTATVGNSTITTNRVTASLSPSSVSLVAGTPINGGSSTGTTQSVLTINTVAATATGRWDITLAGTSGAKSDSTTVSVVVVASGTQGINVDSSGFLAAPAGTTGSGPGVKKYTVSCNPSPCATATTVNLSNTFVSPGPGTGATITIDTPIVTLTPAQSTVDVLVHFGLAITVPDGIYATIMLVCFGIFCIPLPNIEVVWTQFTLSAISYGVLANDNFGANAFTIEVFEQNAQNGLLNNGWIRAINNVGAGLPNFFTWLNAWNPVPPNGTRTAIPGTIRQGFKQTTSSVSPFIDSTIWDAYIDGNIYDSLTVTNPLSGGQLIDWMTLSISQLSNSSLTYTPPKGPPTPQFPNGQPTVSNFRFTLRSDMFFQDGTKVTAFDVAFSYLAGKGVGAFAYGGTAPMNGITILGPSQFDINVNAVGPFTLLTLTGPPVIPGAYWSNAGSSTWKSAISTCTATGAPCYPAQYTLGTPATTTACAITCVFPASTMNVNVAQTSASYDPIVAGSLVGSSGWQCGTVTSTGSGQCSSSGHMNPPVGGSYVLSRFGKGLAPGSSVSGIYFRSNGNLAVYLWSQDNGDINHDFLNFSVIAACFGQGVTSAPPCNHFQQGIGGLTSFPNGSAQPVGLGQVAIVNRFVGLNWIAPFNWVTNPPTGIVPLPPVLYEGTTQIFPGPCPGSGYLC